MSAPLDFFVHIPKTAGTTLTRIIEAEYSPAATFNLRGVPGEAERIEQLAEMAPHIRVVTSHLHFGYARRLPQPCRTFTMLREPVARIVSLYHFIARERGMATHQQLKRGELTLEKLAQRQGRGQARFLAGYGARELVADDVLLREAKSNLETQFTVFGLTERFDESLLLYKQALGWQMRGYVRENVTRNKPATTEQELAMIRSHSAIDLELYAFACELFTRRIAAQAPEFAQELTALRRNVQVAQSVGLARAGWRRLREKLGLAVRR